ncbi:RNA polymerase sigma factor [Arthrobacter cryoconiti]|uniref:RNA polymerase sigma factor n=1 Tax=Arthrobacter cryoconiti TaxID=748907 RepID=A0ABV8QWW2_9MICC|nr:RNA polymerase sigma factor [Arthrobacter cryoconiti]MCC9069554.1 RNA polymerase sigma factor [Arthrobacter cryoconiti]
MKQIEDSDAALWERCAQGDPDALGALFDKHADALFRYALSRTRSWHDAEELVSLTFLEAWKQRARLKLERDTLLPWLLGVASNVDRNRARSRRRHEQFLTRLPHSEPAMDHATEIAERLDAEAEVARLLNGTAGLTSGERDAVILCFMNGYSYEETATALRVRLGTVRSRLSRARKKLAAAAPHLAPAERLTIPLESRIS